MLRHKLNALLMTIRRSAAKYSHSTVAARAIPKSRHDGKAGQPRKRFDVVGSLHGVVEVLAQERQADASNQPDQESARNVARLRGPSGNNRHDRRVTDTTSERSP